MRGLPGFAGQCDRVTRGRNRSRRDVCLTDKNFIFLLLLPPPSLPIAPARSQSWPSTHTSPSPLQRDVGWLDLARPGGMAGRTQGGTQQMGGPVGCVARTGHGIFRGPFSLIPLSLTPTNALEPHTTPTACVATAMTTSQGPPWLSDPHDDMKSSTPAYDEAECQTTWQRAQEGLMTTCPAQSRQVGPNDNA